MKNFSKYIFPILISLSALSVSASAAFYSVTGLSKLFAGATLEVTVMAASLEIAKLVIAALLHQYWNSINKLLRIYLTSAVVVLVLITSMGIYGFLTSAYQDTYRKLTLKENQIEFLTQKKDFFQQDVDNYDKELERISTNIATLSNARATSIQVRDTTSSTGVRNTISTAELRLAQARIEAEEDNRRDVQAKRLVAVDSLQKYQLQILDVQNEADETSELGPLQYIAKLTGMPMDKVINILLLVIVFVFDPLAISMVIAASFAFKRLTNIAKEIKFELDQEEEVEVELVPELEDLPDLEEEEEEVDVNDIEVIDEEIVEPPVEEEFDEEHALDQVLNDMVEDVEITQVKEESEPYHTEVGGERLKVTPTTIINSTGSIPQEEFRVNINSKEDEEWKEVEEKKVSLNKKVEKQVVKAKTKLDDENIIDYM